MKVSRNRYRAMEYHPSPPGLTTRTDEPAFFAPAFGASFLGIIRISLQLDLKYNSYTLPLIFFLDGMGIRW
ncbi:unnamed protein product [Amoebophrya sp. A120]|nr:unnamed protein product [Amoebophrya sp. A120]|eukprot:GSA120T00014906001.1